MHIVNITVDRAIIHEVVPATQLESRPPLYSHFLVEIDEQGQELVNSRIVDTMSSGSSCVDVLPSESGPESTFHRITSMLDCDDDSFIRTSQNLARDLSLVQTSGAIRRGSALLIQGNCFANRENVRFIAFIKADPGQGLLRRLEGDRITLSHVSDMLLGESQRLLKVALFIEEVPLDNSSASPRIPDDFSIKIFDHLLQNSGDRAAANYFISSFLKCILARNAPQQTKKFYNITVNYIFDCPSLTNEEKSELHGDLISYLRNNDTAIIQPREFARSVLPQELQDNYIQECNNQELNEGFSKDTSLLKGKLRRRSVKFDTNVTLYAPPDVFDQYVQIQEQDDEGWTNVKIRGSITSS